LFCAFENIKEQEQKASWQAGKQAGRFAGRKEGRKEAPKHRHQNTTTKPPPGVRDYLNMLYTQIYIYIYSSQSRIHYS